MTKSAEQIVNEINALAGDVVVESNDGTHGLDPQWHTWWTYERLDGSRYTVGRKGAGYVRHHTHLRPAARREQIAALQSLLRTVQSEAEMRARQQFCNGHCRRSYYD